MAGRTKSSKVNQRLVEARGDLKMTAKKAAERIGISYSDYLRFENNGKSPIAAKGRLLMNAKMICEFHGLGPDHFWPEYFTPESAKFAGQLFEGARSIFPSPEEILSIKTMREAIREVLASLTQLEGKVLRMRFGIGEKTDYSPEEISGDLEVPLGRVRQIKAQALRKMRHPTRSRRLKEYL